MTDVTIDNRQDKTAVSKELEALIRRSILETLEAEEVPGVDEVEVLLVDNDAIQTLNRLHRQQDVPTDVLSFPLFESLRALREAVGKGFPTFLGDIVLSLEKAVEQAETFGHSLERETAYLTVHSVLHLLGYDHMNEEEKAAMRLREEAVMARLHLER